ncbi:matrix-remodeling-associated protein 7-like isoform X1 [Amphiprion ocellaris]|uniref:matrix-remodeling-associated protein 7-like isoform X1 n=1 Tax=Amphiprion ocellaris TaxID=80972 RepID=UPI0024117209|nr:matrix-remodeling-associated protein 7-like isoform X1 [Amphiprion ocellaris]
MDVTFVLSAIIFTLLAIVVATSLLNGSSPATDFAKARSYFGHHGDAGGLAQNGHVPDKKKKQQQQQQQQGADDWSDISGSSHDHWDVVKSVLSDEAQPHFHTEGLAPPAEVSSSRSSLSVPGPRSRHMSFEVDSSSEASSCRGPRSFIGLSDSELLKCAFSYPQTEGATESPGINDVVDSNDSNSLKYVPGKARSHHLETMMSKDELEEEQRVQHEQLAAIFQLLKDNKETFGDVSEGDMEEQLRLYSI